MPDHFIGLRQLSQSNRWNEFVTSTALGMQLTITLFITDMSEIIVLPRYCSQCGKVFAPLHPGELEKQLALNDNSGVIIDLGDELSMFAQGLCCIESTGSLPLPDRAQFAAKLLRDFRYSMGEGLVSGRMAVELTTLRRMNHIIISMFQGDEKALERALDLILSSLIIMLEAQGSWITYIMAGEEITLKKGLVDSLWDIPEEILRKDFTFANFQGTLGIVGPANEQDAQILLPLLIQECIIAFEIKHLFEQVRLQVASIFDSLSSAVMLINRQGIINYVNAAAEKILNISRLELIASEASTWSYPWIKHILNSRTDALSRYYEPLELSGETKWIDWKLNPLYEDGKIMGWVVFIDDRTEFHKWLVVSRQAERFSTMATMVGALAHEMRNPLTAALGVLQILSRNRSPERVMTNLGMVFRELDRIKYLLDQFLLLGKPAVISGELIYLDKFLEDLKPLLQLEITSFNLELIYFLQPVSPIMVDSRQLVQVILNLIRNARDAAVNPGKIQISLRENQGWVELKIQDNGKGFLYENPDDAFQPFFTTKDRCKGLGLSIAKTIICNHGGWLSAANGEQGGAVITIELPIQYYTGNSQCHLDVLISIENGIVRHSIEQAFRGIGYRVLSLSTLGRQEELLERYNPSLLLTETASVSGEQIEAVLKIWPHLQLVGIGEKFPGVFPGSWSILPDSSDYVKMLETVQNLIGPPNITPP